MIKLFRFSFYKNGYLLIIAAWLFTISFILSRYTAYSFSPFKVKQEIERYLADYETRFDNIANDTALLLALKKHQPSAGAVDRKVGEMGLFIYPNGVNTVPLFWSSNKMLPDAKDLRRPEGNFPSIHPNGYFEFINKQVELEGQLYKVCAMIPVYWNYGLNNKYLQTRFPIDNFERRYTLVATGSDVYINSGDKKTLFGLQQKDADKKAPPLWPLVFRLLAVVFFLVWLNALATDLANKKGWLRGIVFLTVSVVVLRYLSYVLPFPFEYRILSLFDSTIYGSNFLHPTLGDLFINMVLLYWLVSVAKEPAIDYLKNRQQLNGLKAGGFAVLSSIILASVAFAAAGITRSLINDSQISFDVTNAFSLSIYSYLSFVILCFIILSFFHISHILLLSQYKIAGMTLYHRMLLVAFVSLLYLTFVWRHTASVSNLFVLLWLLTYIFFMERRRADIYQPVLRSSYFIIWMMFFAASISALIIFQNKIVAEQKRLPEAEKLATEADRNAQSIFSTGISDIDSAFLSDNLYNFRNQTTNKSLKDSLMGAYLSINADSYDYRIYTYDENGLPLYNDDSVSIYTLKNLIGKAEQIAPDVYNFQRETNLVSFIYQKQMKDTAGQVKGYFFISGDPKKYKSQAVFPELFMPGNTDETEKNTTYAVYNKGKLVESNGDYNFMSYIPLNEYPRNMPQNIKTGSQWEYRYNAGNGKLLVIVYAPNYFLEFITLFAYLFITLLLIIVLFQTGFLLVKYKFNIRRIFKNVVLNIKYQIQTAILFISVFSFVIIGVATISFYIKRFKQTNRERLIKSMKMLTNEIQQQAHNDPYRLESDAGNLSTLDKSLKTIAEIHGVDANLYDINGNLFSSTQPEIFKKQILSSMMNLSAYDKLSRQQRIQFLDDETVSNFSFLSIYAPVYNQSGQTYAYLNIPYLNTQKELNQEISNFLVTLINLNAFIFLIAGAISVLLTNRITGSFSLIADKMNKINLGSANEQIVWSSSDEIGALVNEYNKMVKKLEDSALALAKSEREGAWREMARQVAHEIKNPLTPMKLSIQYLQKAILENKPNVVEMSRKTSQTLIEQIDQLSKIASDFSHFANITKVKNEVFDITELLNSLINLYSANQRLHVVYKHGDSPIHINADRSQINRLFTNLFQNAVEASEDKPVVHITIRQVVQNGQLIIDFADEGSGIPLDKQQNIFTPNFTTKSSGTGLGLAICKGIVESASGRIWFTTKVGVGTTFHILLPVCNEETA